MRPRRMPGPPPTRESPPHYALVGSLFGPVEVTLAAGPGAPVAARAAVNAWLAGRVGETMLADALLLVSELVANSVRHADAPAHAVVSVRAHVRADVLCLEVEDRGRTGSIARRAPDLQHGGGFGLNLVEVVSGAGA